MRKKGLTFNVTWSIRDNTSFCQSSKLFAGTTLCCCCCCWDCVGEDFTKEADEGVVGVVYNILIRETIIIIFF